MAEPMIFDVTALVEPGYTLHLEPEGMSYEVIPGSGYRLAFEPSPSGASIEVTWTPDGLRVHRAVDAGATVSTQDGKPLDW